MPAPRIRSIGLTDAEVRVLRALRDLDHFTPGGYFTLKQVAALADFERAQKASPAC